MGDVAERAGVSKMTVSLALRGNSRLAKATEARVRKVAQEMGYVPDPMLSALNMHKYKLNKSSLTETLAAVYSVRPVACKDGNVRNSAKFDSLRRTAESFGFGIEEFCLPDYTADRLVSVLKARGIRGVVCLADARDGFQSSALKLDVSGFTAIQVGCADDMPSMPCVDHDAFAAVATAFNHLLARGYTKPAMLFHGNGMSALQQRYFAAFHAYSAQLSAQEALPVCALDSGKTGCAALNAFFAQHKPDVVLSPDFEVLTALRAQSAKLRRLPGFICLNLDSPDCAASGIHLQQDSIFATVLEMMETDLRHNRRGPLQIRRTVLLPGQWLDGGTF